MSSIDSASTASVTTADGNTENEASISSQSSVLEDVAEKYGIAVGKAARERNLDPTVVYGRMSPIDICVFGRSGIGKSQLIKAITHLDINTSSQIDHVTQTLTEATTTIGELKFRFWDTRGIDNWLDLDAVDNLFNEMKERKIQPIFIIYCAAAGGRVDSDIVAAILKQFQLTKIPICYVITNIYAASDDQLTKQIEGGRLIMGNVFDPFPDQIEELCFQYRNTTSNDPDDDLLPKKGGILVGVNSCPFRNRMGTMPIYNIHELMNFLAGNLVDEDFCKFVALTMNNRDFWDRFSDVWHTRLKKATDAWDKWKINTVSFFKRLFGLTETTSTVDI